MTGNSTFMPFQAIAFWMMAEHYSVKYTIYDFYVNGKIIFLVAFFCRILDRHFSANQKGGRVLRKGFVISDLRTAPSRFTFGKEGRRGWDANHEWTQMHRFRP